MNKNSKGFVHLFLLITLLVAVFGIGYYTHRKVQTKYTQATWTTLKSTEFPYQISLPSSVTVQKVYPTPKNGESFVFSSPELDYTLWINVWDNPRKLSPPDWSNEQQRSSKAIDDEPPVNLPKTPNIYVSRTPAFRVEREYSPLWQPARVVYIQKEDNIYEIKFSYNEERVKNSDIFDQILSTFKFIEE